MNPVSPSNDLRLLLNQENEDHSSSYEHLTNIANSINHKFLEPMFSFTPLGAMTSPIDDSALLSDVITVDKVFQLLVLLKPSKASRLPGLPASVLKENTNVLAEAVNNILHSSYGEYNLPSSWKKADITPLPKQKPVLDAGKHLRPISLTPTLSESGRRVCRRRFHKSSYHETD